MQKSTVNGAHFPVKLNEFVESNLLLGISEVFSPKLIMVGFGAKVCCCCVALSKTGNVNIVNVNTAVVFVLTSAQQQQHSPSMSSEAESISISARNDSNGFFAWISRSRTFRTSEVVMVSS